MKRAKSMELALALMLLGISACTSTDDGTSGASGTAEGTSSSVHVLAGSDCPDYSCEGALEPGQYRATYYDPTITFDIVSQGWSWSYSGVFVLVADDSPTEVPYSPDGIYFFLDPAIASHNCKDSAERGVGRTVDDLVAWLGAAPGLAVTDPTPVTMGGLDGVQLDLELDAAWTRPCFWSDGLPAVPLIFSPADIGGYNWAILPDMSMRWYVLALDDGVLIVDVEDNPDGLSNEDMLRTGTEIAESLAFS